MGRSRIAFFDVDGTLTHHASIFRFLSYYLAATGHPPHVYQQARQKLKAMTAMGIPREETNRAYFENLVNAHDADVKSIARQWYQHELDEGHFLNDHGIQALRAHQEAGDIAILVSGSFPALLDPIAAHLGTDETWCTSPETRMGRYTGRLSAPPMIGQRKADAVLMSAAIHCADRQDTTGYGDHASDLPMLEAVGTAVVISKDENMRATAQCRGWRLIPPAVCTQRLHGA